MNSEGFEGVGSSKRNPLCVSLDVRILVISSFACANYITF